MVVTKFNEKGETITQPPTATNLSHFPILTNTQKQKEKKDKGKSGKTEATKNMAQEKRTDVSAAQNPRLGQPSREVKITPTTRTTINEKDESGDGQSPIKLDYTSDNEEESVGATKKKVVPVPGSLFEVTGIRSERKKGLLLADESIMENLRIKLQESAENNEALHKEKKENLVLLEKEKLRVLELEARLIAIESSKESCLSKLQLRLQALEDKAITNGVGSTQINMMEVDTGVKKPDANLGVSPKATVNMIKGNDTAGVKKSDSNPKVTPTATLTLGLQGNVTAGVKKSDSTPKVTPNATVTAGTQGNDTAGVKKSDANLRVTPKSDLPLTGNPAGVMKPDGLG